MATVVNCRLQQIVVRSNSGMQHAIMQLFNNTLINSLSRSNRDLFKCRYSLYLTTLIVTIIKLRICLVERAERGGVETSDFNLTNYATLKNTKLHEQSMPTLYPLFSMSHLERTKIEFCNSTRDSTPLLHSFSTLSLLQNTRL